MPNHPDKLTAEDHALEKAIQDLLQERGPGKTICPSEAARRVSPDDWRSLMEHARSAAQRLASRRQIAITQRGKPIDPTRTKGAIRLKSRD